MTLLRNHWTTIAPPVGILTAVASLALHPSGILALVVGFVLLVCVLAAVDHAELIAHRIGEPYGSIVLAVAVTVIEAGLIIVLMLEARGGDSSLVRDTSFAAAMITCNLIVGASLIAGGGRRSSTTFSSEGSASALATVIVLVSLVFVTPTLTESTPRSFNSEQLWFAAVTSLAIYVAFIVTQTMHHRAIFLPVDNEGEPMELIGHDTTAPSRRATVLAGIQLVAALTAVIVIAKSLTGPLTEGVRSAGLPYEVVGVLIALMVLLPESIAAVRNARRGFGQTSLNLAYGSMIACVGLTIPSVVVAAWLLDVQLLLGLDPLHIALLVITFFISTLTVLPGRAVRLDGTLHVLVFAAFVWLTLFP